MQNDTRGHIDTYPGILTLRVNSKLLIVSFKLMSQSYCHATSIQPPVKPKSSSSDIYMLGSVAAALRLKLVSPIRPLVFADSLRLIVRSEFA